MTEEEAERARDRARELHLHRLQATRSNRQVPNKDWARGREPQQAGPVELNDTIIAHYWAEARTRLAKRKK